MNRALLPLLAACLLGVSGARAADAQTIEGWGKARFGMSADEFNQIFPSDCAPIAPVRIRICLVRKPVDLSEGIVGGRMRAVFIEDRLTTVSFEDKAANGNVKGSRYRSAMLWLTRSYGFPFVVPAYPIAKGTVHQAVTWVFPDKASIIVDTELGDAGSGPQVKSLEIAYRAPPIHASFEPELQK